MLTIFGRPQSNGGFCDGVTRRDFLTIGGSLLGGLTLPQLLRAEARARPGQRAAANHKAIINIYLPGGPPHLDMWDIKVDAPREIRGEFDPIQHQRARHRHLRAVSTHRPHGRQVHLHPFHRRFRRRPRCLPVHDRPEEDAADGQLLAHDGFVGVEVPGHRSTSRFRPICR